MAAPRPTDVLDHVDEQDEVITGEAVALQLRPTNWILRAAGCVIDWLAYMGAAVLIFIALFYAASSLRLDPALVAAVQIPVVVTISWVVLPLVVELVSKGKSLGRLAVGARIVRDDGGAIGFRQAFIRALVGLLEIFMTLGGLAAIVGLLSAKSKRLGDMLAGTYSQQERVSGQPAPVFGVPFQLVEWSRTADVARMPDPLARRISQFLAQSKGLTAESRRRLSVQLANEVSPYVSPLPTGADPELFLAAVSVVRREREYAALQLEQRIIERLRPALEGRPHDFPDRG
jgi:uncharacterized RDD family membrane protein YckC